MPIYAFECTACGHDFDRLQKLSDADPVQCPACSAEGGIRRRLTAPQFRLAGGGWYETDFKKDGDRKRNLAGDSAAPSGGSDAKGDSKAVESKPAETKTSEAKPAPATPAPKPDSKPAG